MQNITTIQVVFEDGSKQAFIPYTPTEQTEPQEQATTPAETTTATPEIVQAIETGLNIVGEVIPEIKPEAAAAGIVVEEAPTIINEIKSAVNDVKQIAADIWEKIR